MTDAATTAAVIGWLQETNIQAAIIGPAISTLISWIAYAYRQSQKRRANIAKLIQKIERLAIEHWCSPGADTNNKIRGIRISNELQTLSWRIDQKKLENRKALISYRKAVTGGDFADPAREDLAFADPRIALIKRCARDLRKALNIKKEH